MNDLIDEARRWLADDPDPATRDELASLIGRAGRGDTAALDGLADRFSGLLQFGTAGLRGTLGAGPNRMNRAVVIRTAAGLAGYLLASRVPARGGRHRVIVGYDARHRSHAFAVDTAAVMTAAGIDTSIMPRPIPTPVLAFAVRQLDADAGVMVTASHNPPQDNGYKVYLGGSDGGAQIVPPADTEIASRIAAVETVAEVPRASGGWAMMGEDVVDAYIRAAAKVAPPGGPREVRIVLTSLHGVGGTTALAALRQAGFTDVHPVPEQAEPDPDFPTVAFPNPEEPGAIDLALTLAHEIGADVVIANDPDADRCAVAVPGDPGHGHRWRMLRGDEVGALLGGWLAQRRGDWPRGVFANSIVSSRLLGQIAAAHGIGHVETLTGFKWISRVPGIIYGYEEALGYCVAPHIVRDKDGISAAVLVAEMVADGKARGYTLTDRLDDLALAHGLYATDQRAIRADGLARITAAMGGLRDSPLTTLGGSTVVSADDLLAGSGDLPPTDGLRYLTADGSRVIVRPSGTELKLKCYLEVVIPVSSPAELPRAKETADGRLRALRAHLARTLPR